LLPHENEEGSFAFNLDTKSLHCTNLYALKFTAFLPKPPTTNL
jgi:hypothetical protein